MERYETFMKTLDDDQLETFNDLAKRIKVEKSDTGTFLVIQIGFTGNAANDLLEQWGSEV